MFLPAGGEPVVGEGVTELVRMDGENAGIGAPPLEHLTQTRVGQAALAPDQPPSCRGLVVPVSKAEIAAQARARIAEWIEEHNRDRRHSSCGMRSPIEQEIEMRRQAGPDDRSGAA